MKKWILILSMALLLVSCAEERMEAPEFAELTVLDFTKALRLHNTQQAKLLYPGIKDYGIDLRADVNVDSVIVITCTSLEDGKFKLRTKNMSDASGAYDYQYYVQVTEVEDSEKANKDKGAPRFTAQIYDSKGFFPKDRSEYSYAVKYGAWAEDGSSDLTDQEYLERSKLIPILKERSIAYVQNEIREKVKYQHSNNSRYIHIFNNTSYDLSNVRIFCKLSIDGESSEDSFMGDVAGGDSFFDLGTVFLKDLKMSSFHITNSDAFRLYRITGKEYDEYIASIDN